MRESGLLYVDYLSYALSLMINLRYMFLKMTCKLMKIYRGKDLRKGRVSCPNQIYLVTAVTAYRKPIFCNYSAGRIVVRELKEAECRGRVTSLAFVVMPDHLHWLVSISPEYSISDVVGSMKRYSAVSFNQSLGNIGVQVWQRGFHDHALRSDEDILRVARYIVANPLRAGLVKRIGEYPLWDAVWL